MRRGTILIGLVLTSLGSFFILAPAERFRALATGADRNWPYLLLALAALNIFRAVLPNGRWIAPAVLGTAGTLGLLEQSGLDLPQRALGLLPAFVVVAGVTSVVTGLGKAGEGPIIALLWSRIVGLDAAASRISVHAYLADLTADLTQVSWSGDLWLRAVALLGVVRIRVPNDVSVLLHDGGFLLGLYETGPRRDPCSATLHLDVGGALGWIEVIRG